MFNHCLTTDALDEALLDAMIEMNNGECLDDSIEFDALLAAQHPAEHQAMCEAYRVQLDIVFYLEHPEYAE